MPSYEIAEKEGMRAVQIHLQDETVRAEAGALAHMRGRIVMDSSLLPTAKGLLAAYLSEESMFRPTFTGTGVVCLEPTLGGYHILDLAEGDSWVLSPGAYWASDASVELTVFREPMLTAFWAGEGLFYYETSVKGPGKVVLNSEGPVEVVELADDALFAQGKEVIARTQSISFGIRRPTRTWLGRYTSGEGFSRHYKGTGSVLLCPVPYWRLRYGKNPPI